MEKELTSLVLEAIENLYGASVNASAVSLQKTKKEFDGDLTLVVFPFLKISRKNPVQTATEVGEYLKEKSNMVTGFNVIKGFLNLCIAKEQWIQLLAKINEEETYGFVPVTDDSPLAMVEYSSPNTNKPLHLGHVRNNLLGYSVAEILKANGNKLVKTNIVNDRGVHICKSMLAWQKFGNGATPSSSGEKGDHLVGNYYVAFDKAYKAEIKSLMKAGMEEDEAKKKAPLMVEAQEMLLKWEAGDKDVRNLWKMMNEWVYTGFDVTYKRLGVNFDKIYYESDTYLTGKDKVEEGLNKEIFFTKEDGSVWADLTAEGLDQKLLLRSDGTSVYMTQDIGTAALRFADYTIDKMIYVVGNEQNYHFQVLSIVLDKLGFSWGKDLVHFSYGMVELPEGKMKSREGTVVDADDLMDEMIGTAASISKDLGKLDGLSEAEFEKVTTQIGLGALKYFMLKVDPRKNMTFNPKESIDFSGNTASFIQYSFARIQSILRKANEQNIDLLPLDAALQISEKEVSLVQYISSFPLIVKQAGDEYSPSVIANYTYELVREFNQFYHDYSILKEEDEAMRNFRLVLAKNVAKIVKQAMGLLGIEMPNKM